jgi:hypothetical protein
VGEATRVPLGTNRGLRFGLVLHTQFPADVYLKGLGWRSLSRTTGNYTVA